MSAHHVPLAALAIAGLLTLTGCGSGGSTAASPMAHHSGGMSMSAGGMQHMSGATITIKSFAYSGPKSVKAGAEVMVTNNDSETHSVTADSGGAFDVTVDPGKTMTFKAPTKPGTYPFHCNFHSNMTGVLTVR